MIKKLIAKSPQLLNFIAKKRLVSACKRAAKEVPLYRKLLQEHNIDMEKFSFKDFHKLPEIDKKSYIHKATSIKDLVRPNAFKEAGLIYRSSGYSGYPSFWIKSKGEINEARQGYAVALRSVYKTRTYTTLMINCFSLGSWVAGMSVARFMDVETSILNLGTNKEEAIEAIKSLGKHFDQIILAGYPPFVKNLLESGEKEIHWKNLRLHIVLGGEGFSPSFRKHLYEHYIDQTKGSITSAYASADLGLPGGNETPQTKMVMDELIRTNSLTDLFNGREDEAPMLFQYNPINFYIYTNENKELVFTSLSPQSVQPLIKYNLHDRGGVISYKKMQYYLKERNINITFPFKLPFIYVYGRSQGELKLHGRALYPENIKEAIYANPQISKQVTGVFKMYLVQKGGETRLHIDLELKQSLKPTPLLKKNFTKFLQQSLSKTCSAYQKLEALTKEQAELQITLFEHGKFPHEQGLKNIYT
ncbi:MAG: hypothetical protein WC595_05980 [Candidatus Nanoarchaeia archaeon]